MNDREDAFLSDEDLDLRTLSDEELITYWNLWLGQAQISNDLDEATYSHGVFERDPAVPAQRPDGDSQPRTPRSLESTTLSDPAQDRLPRSRP
jgi:hypothetical protein